jgi:hypothetical protein
MAALFTAKNKNHNSTNRMRRILQIFKDYQWQVALTLFVIAFTLGYIGFYKYTNSIGNAYAPTDLLYLTLQLTTLESGAVSGPVSWELEIARWLVPMATAYTAILAATALFQKHLQMVRLWYIRKHIIICGLGDKGWLLALQFSESGRNVVVIEKDTNNDRIVLCRENGIVVIEGNATSSSILQKATIQRASYLVAVCGEDGVNAEVAMKARQLSTKRKAGALICTIHIVNPQLCNLLREQEFGYEAFPTFRLEMFNIFERGARAFLEQHSPFKKYTKNASPPPHILIIGLGRLGENLIVQTARTWYESYSQNHKLLRISVVDTNAEVKVALLQESFPKLSSCCELNPLQMNLEDIQFQHAEFLFDESGHCDVTSIFICLRNHTLGLQSALQLRQRLARNQPRIIVRMQEENGLAKLLILNQESRITFQNIIPFGLLQHSCTPDLVIGGTHEILAQAVHEDYLQHRLTKGFVLGQKRSLVHWDELPGDLRESNRRQVDQIRLKLQIVGYGIAPLSDWEAANYRFSVPEIEKMAEFEHVHWVQERERNGWRFAPGPEDNKKKTHPDLLPWNQLPETTKEKVRQPSIELPKLLARAGFQVYKLNEK